MTTAIFDDLAMPNPSDFDRVIEDRTGMTVEQITRTSIAQMRRRTEKRYGFRMRFRSFWPLIGRGNIMHGRTKSHAEVEATLTEALR